MILKWWEKLRRNSRARRRIRRGTIYHNHCNEIILNSAEELRIQLRDAHSHKNLIWCIVHGKADPQYQQRLILASLKLELIGGMFYPISDSETAKLPVKAYRRFWDDWMETVIEAKDWLERVGAPVTDAAAQNLLARYQSIRDHCLRFLASGREVYFARTYYELIDWIVDCEPIPKAEFDNPHIEYPNLPFVPGFQDPYDEMEFLELWD